MCAMTRDTERGQKVYARFSRLLEYPWPGLLEEVQDARDELAGNCPEASGSVQEFLRAAQGMTLEGLRECYTRAFDMAPQCIPYLSVYLFGEESYKRSELMTGLLEAYEKADYPRGSELPDHLAVVLGYAPHCPPGEWDDLARWCMPGPLAEMTRGLARAGNPYSHLLQGLVCVFKAQYPQEFRHV